MLERENSLTLDGLNHNTSLKGGGKLAASMVVTGVTDFAAAAMIDCASWGEISSLWEDFFLVSAIRIGCSPRGDKTE